MSKNKYYPLGAILLAIFILASIGSLSGAGYTTPVIILSIIISGASAMIIPFLFWIPKRRMSIKLGSVICIVNFILLLVLNSILLVNFGSVIMGARGLGLFTIINASFFIDWSDGKDIQINPRQKILCPGCSSSLVTIKNGFLICGSCGERFIIKSNLNAASSATNTSQIKQPLKQEAEIKEAQVPSFTPQENKPIEENANVLFSFCPQCGSKLTTNAHFCQNCGTKLNIN